MTSLIVFLIAASLGQAADAEPRFEIRTGDGLIATSTVVSIGEGFTITTNGSKNSTFPGKDLVSLHRAGTVTPAMPKGPTVTLTSGDHIPLEAETRLEEESLRFE